MQRNGQYQPSKGEKKKPEEAKPHFFGLTGLCDRTGVLPHDRTC